MRIPFIGGSIGLFPLIIGFLVGSLWGEQVTSKIPGWDKVKKMVGK